MDSLTIIFLITAIATYILSTVRKTERWDLYVLSILLAVGSIVSALLSENVGENEKMMSILVILINFYIMASSIVSLGGGKNRWPVKTRLRF